MARKPTVNVLVRFPPEQHAVVKAAAEKAGVSLNSFIVNTVTGARTELPEGTVVVDGLQVPLIRRTPGKLDIPDELPPPDPEQDESFEAGLLAAMTACLHPPDKRIMGRCGACGGKP
jgi:hypothetical protein